MATALKPNRAGDADRSKQAACDVDDGRSAASCGGD